MRITVEIDDATIARARRMSGVEDVTDLVRVCMKQWMEHEAARSLAALGANDPSATNPPRRRV